VELYLFNRVFDIPLTAFIVGTILSKIQSNKNQDGEKLFMKWIFIKRLKK
jgi:hypothetical protein